MTPPVHAPALALRFVLTVLAGGLLGFDRSRNGHPAGLRTTLLVTLAASIAMMQMDLLLPTSGKNLSSFSVMDVMRLPLGILTGVGFIGAGAIVRRGDIVLGITTAATLWYATVVGLCLGAGQIVLGSVAAVLGYLILSALRWLERRVEQFQPATLVLVTSGGALSAGDLRARLEAARVRIRSISVEDEPAEQQHRIRCEVRWPSLRGAAGVPHIVDELRQTPGLIRLSWRAQGTGPN